MTEYIKSMRKHIGHERLLIVGASVCVHKDGKLLLQRRKDNGCWADHGGCGELGEDVEETAKRELYEETGLVANKLELLGVFSGKELFYTYPNGDKVSNVTVTYLCEDFTGEMLTETDETSRMRWFSLDELPGNISPPVKPVLEKCVEVLKSRRKLTNHEILKCVKSQLAINMNCASADFDSNDSAIFTVAKDNPGRIPFPREKRHLEMLSMGKSVVVTASPEVLKAIKPLLEGKTRDEVFSMPFVCGHGLLYLPDLTKTNPIAAPDGFSYEMIEKDAIPALYRFEGFRNALQYDANHLRPDVLAVAAKKDGDIVGLAGASEDSAKMWQIGIDVLPEHRNLGLAAYLVSRLTLEILSRGFIPYYGAASSNIISQRVARRVGYESAWVHAYKFNFDWFDSLPTVKPFNLK